jgi:formate dehydrogenase gamma subunit
MARFIIQEEQIVRFDIHQRIQHAVMMVSFILLAFTGLPLKFHDWSVSQWWIGFWGGVESTRAVHHFAAWVMVFDCVYHLLYIGYTTLILKRPLAIKMIPTIQDFRDFFQEIGYFLGVVREKPRFDRFNWREKFDYWAIFWGMPIIGISGFIMMYPVFVTKFLPGWVVPAAFVAHGDEAVLAVAWIFLVHFFFNHLAPGVFPLNTSIFTGKVPRERYRREHPLEYERLSSSGGEQG